MNDTFTTKVGIRTEVLTQKGLIINSENDIADSYLGKKIKSMLYRPKFRALDQQVINLLKKGKFLNPPSAEFIEEPEIIMK